MRWKSRVPGRRLGAAPVGAGNRTWVPRKSRTHSRPLLMSPAPITELIRVVYSSQSISTSESVGVLEATGKFLTVGGFREKFNRI